MLQGAIFDLDGTLLDSMPVWNTLASTYLRKIGCTTQADVDAAVRSLSMRQTARYFREECGVSIPEQEIMDGVIALIQHFYEDEVLPKKGAAAFLQQLSQRNVRMCVATATDARLAKAALTRCGLMRFLSAIITCDSAGAGKNQPIIYREALARLETPKAKTLVFEDACHAIRTARADGFITVAIQDASEPDQKKLRAFSDHMITNYADTKAFWLFADKL